MTVWQRLVWVTDHLCECVIWVYKPSWAARDTDIMSQLYDASVTVDGRSGGWDIDWQLVGSSTDDDVEPPVWAVTTHVFTEARTAHVTVHDHVTHAPWASSRSARVASTQRPVHVVRSDSLILLDRSLEMPAHFPSARLRHVSTMTSMLCYTAAV